MARGKLFPFSLTAFYKGILKTPKNLISVGITVLLGSVSVNPRRGAPSSVRYRGLKGVRAAFLCVQRQSGRINPVTGSRSAPEIHRREKLLPTGKKKSILIENRR